MGIWKRVTYTTVAVGTIVTLGATGTSAAGGIDKIMARQHMCAEFTDTVGLYEGNYVTMLGVQVGTVEKIEPRGDRMKVSLKIDKDMALPADVGAVTMSSSIVTDRRVELTKPYTVGPQFDWSQCIPLERTKTPLGISEAFDAVGKLTGDLLGPDGVPNAGRPATTVLADTLSSADRALSGTGPQFNAMLKQVSDLVGNPADRDVVFRRLVDNLDSLTTMFVTNWPDMKALLDNLGTGLELIDGVASNLRDAIDLALQFLPVIVRNVEKYDQQSYAFLDKAVPFAHELLSRGGNINELLSYLPRAAQNLMAFFDPAAQGVRVQYRPPQFDVKVDGQQTRVDLVHLLLGSAAPR